MADNQSVPSIFLGSLAGYAAATAVGSLLVVWLSVDAGRATAEGGLKLLLSVGALGAYLGYAVAVKRRRRRGVSGPHDEWANFFGSWTFAAIAVVVLAGSLGVAVLIKVAFDAIAGRAV